MSKKIKGGKRKKRKWNKTIAILLCITAIVTIITLSAVYYSPPPPPPPVSKEPADEYFSFSGGIAIAEAKDSENRTILIEQAGFYITVVGGNATNVLIRPLQGNVPLEDTWHTDKLVQGETVEVGPIMYPFKVLSNKEAEGWPLLFDITCNEAEGEVTVYIDFFVPRGP